MALTVKSDNQASWWIAYRNGGFPSGTVYNALVSDLAVDDYLVGARAKVKTLGSTTSGNRAMTIDRNGTTMSVSWPAASSVQIIR